MKKLMVIICLLFAGLSFNTVSAQPPFPPGRGDRENAPDEMKRAVQEFQRLIRENQAQGRDISGALELDRKSREAMRGGNREEALRLVKEAIRVLENGGAPAFAPQQAPSRKSYRAQKVELSVQGTKVFLTKAVPDYDAGRQISTYASAFSPTTLEVVNGKVSLDIGPVPVLIEEAGVRREAGPTNHHFGFQGEGLNRYDAAFSDLGHSIIRYAGRTAAWDLIERTKGNFDWSFLDTLVGETSRTGIDMLITVKSLNQWDQQLHGLGGRTLVKPKMPNDLNAYQEFLAKLVKRYDTVKYWQIENEVDGNFWGDTPEHYAQLLSVAYTTIKKANPNAMVVMAGVSFPRGFREFYVPVLRALRTKPGKHFDIFDFHWYGRVGDYKALAGYNFAEYVREIKTELAGLEYGDIPLWITETGTYSDSPVGKSGRSVPPQSETEQASELIKRYVSFMSAGVERIFWSQLVEVHHGGMGIGVKNDEFENIGIINNPSNDGDSSKKLAYSSYKFLAEKLGRWKRIDTLNIGEGIHGYRFVMDRGTITVLWTD